MAAYKHGAFSTLEASVAQNATQASTVAVYVGLAPVNLIRNYAEKEIINLPVKLSDFLNAQKTVGYTKNWTDFTLCEAIGAHLDNRLGAIGPIYVVNVLDPDKHRKSAPTTLNVAFTNGIAEFKSDTVILDTIALADKAIDVDFTVAYNFTSGKVILTSIGETKLDGQVEGTYYDVDPAAVTEDDIIGANVDGVYSGLQAVSLLYQRENKVTNLISCLKFNTNKKVYNAMVSLANGINGHWQAYCIGDIPIKDGDNAIDTFAKARKWREDNGYTNENIDVFYPMAYDNATERIYHTSTLAMVEAMRTDDKNDGVPFESYSNKEIPITKQYFGADSKNQGFDQVTASNELNAYGIGTVCYWGGKWVLWCGHTAKYAEGKDIDVRAIDSHYMRMLFHMMNGFQLRHADKIDGPFSVQTKDSILIEEQEIIDGYIAAGALLPGSRVIFLASENPIGDMINGDFKFDIPTSVTPRAKSLTGRVYYTDEGLASLVEEA
ncbi:MAG: phage tail sheath family protein [Clostridia bacterium]|nr:phage tail sheath family protein [Clostridia bacterium]